MSDEPVPRLSGEQVLALRFAARRQLARWSNRSGLSSHQHTQRTALTRAVIVLEDKAVANGCELRATNSDARH